MAGRKLENGYGGKPAVKAVEPSSREANHALPVGAAAATAPRQMKIL
jgi:hypothetical protein